MNENAVEIVRASVQDVPAIAALVERYVRRGEVLPRSPAEIYQSLREWVVAKCYSEVVGCGSLVILWADMAEIRSLIVLPELQGVGIGRQLVCALLAEAAALGIPRVIALTRKPAFFAKLGFVEVPRASLPRKIWKDCIHCTKFAGCDEVAMVYELSLKVDKGQEVTTCEATIARDASTSASQR
ncbi:MAG: N-acetyltransferase [Anaerolineae bacterium]